MIAYFGEDGRTYCSKEKEDDDEVWKGATFKCFTV